MRAFGPETSTEYCRYFQVARIPAENRPSPEQLAKIQFKATLPPWHLSRRMQTRRDHVHRHEHAQADALLGSSRCRDGCPIWQQPMSKPEREQRASQRTRERSIAQ